MSVRKLGGPPPAAPRQTQAAASAGGAPLLPNLPERAVLPPAIRDMAPLDRHLWYFKAASDAGSQKNWSKVQVNTQDHSLSFGDMDTGLKKLGLNGPEAALLSLGVLIDRGGRQLLAGQGGVGKMDISPGALWSTAHPSTAQSGVYDAKGNVDPQKEAAFLNLLDPNGTDKITLKQFQSAGQTLMNQRDAGNGLGERFKRWMDEGTFDRAWNSFMTVAGHTDPATGEKYVTREDVRWFFDGTYFYRLAEAKQGTPPRKSNGWLP